GDRVLRFSRVAADGGFGGGGAAVVEEGAAVAEAPEGGGAEFVSVGVGLLDAVSGSDVVEEEVGEERDGLAVKGGIGVPGCGQHGRVARRAADRLEEGFAFGLALRGRDGGKEAHEVLEVVDAAEAGLAVADVLNALLGTAEL